MSENLSGLIPYGSIGICAFEVKGLCVPAIPIFFTHLKPIHFGFRCIVLTPERVGILVGGHSQVSHIFIDTWAKHKIKVRRSRVARF